MMRSFTKPSDRSVLNWEGGGWFRQVSSGRVVQTGQFWEGGLDR